MENREIDLIEIAKSIWDKRRKVIKWGLIGALVGIVISFSLPKQYETVVMIAPEGSSSSSSSSMSGLAAMAGIDFGGSSRSSAGLSSRIYPDILQSTPFLLEFANIEVEYDGQKMSFYDYITKEQKSPWWSAIIGAPIQAMGWVRGLLSSDEKFEEKDTIDIFKLTATQKAFVGTFKSMVTLEMDKKTTIIDITTKMQDPLVTAIIADSMVTKLQRYMTNYRTEKTRNDLKNTSKMLVEAQANYYKADSLYAAAADRNIELLSKSAKIKLDRLENEKSLAFSVYQQLATQVELTRVKLQEDTPIATVIEPASVSLLASSPNKKLIVVAFVFLACFAAVSVVVVQQLMGMSKEIKKE